jgi:LysM repeat protein
LKIGQVLQIPVVQNNRPTISLPVVAEASETEYYVIKSGDNPWKIAKQFHVKFDDLLKLNNLDEEKARNLKIGDKIRIH